MALLLKNLNAVPAGLGLSPDPPQPRDSTPELAAISASTEDLRDTP
jgi:hypothetical protein